MAIGDPDYDFMYLFDEFGNNFLRGILNNYQSSQRNTMSKLEFFTLGNKIQILLKAIEDSSADDIKNGYNELNKWLKKYDKERLDHH